MLPRPAEGVSAELIPDSISAKDYAREEHVDFQEIARDTFGLEDYHPVRAMYRRIRAKVPDADETGLMYSGTLLLPVPRAGLRPSHPLSRCLFPSPLLFDHHILRSLHPGLTCRSFHKCTLNCS